MGAFGHVAADHHGIVQERHAPHVHSQVGPVCREDVYAFLREPQGLENDLAGMGAYDQHVREVLESVTQIVVFSGGEVPKALVDFVEKPEKLLHLLRGPGNLAFHHCYQLILAAGDGDVHRASVAVAAHYPEAILHVYPVHIQAQIVEHPPDGSGLGNASNRRKLVERRIQFEPSADI